MSCETCSAGKKGFCPVTFGLSLGLTCALMVLVCSIAAMYGFNFVEEHMMVKLADNMSDAGMLAVWALVKGFVGGFVFALIYDLICRCKSKCCGKCTCCSSK